LTHPRAALSARHPLKVAMPAAWQSQRRGISGLGHFASAMSNCPNQTMSGGFCTWSIWTYHLDHGKTHQRSLRSSRL
jgi:hypothetical protein